MFELRTFGELALRWPRQRDPQALQSQSKRLALLVYLALAKPRGYHRRDALLAVFWPEADESHARQALRQTLHVLRTELGEGIVLSRGQDEIGLNWDRVWCDAAAFEEAIRVGSHEEALEIYRADLLPGFHLSDAPEFGRFLDDQRATYRQDAAEAAWTLAVGCGEAGDAVGAVRWAGKAMAIEPHEEERLRTVIGRLDALGERVAAVVLYEDFARRLAEDYELEPSPETTDLISSVRSRSETHPPDEATPPPPPRPPDVTLPPVLSPTGAGRRSRRAAAVVIATVIVAAGIALSWIVFLRYGPGRAVPRIAVLPFENVGRGEDAWLAHGMTDEIRSRLANVGGLALIAPQSTNQYRGRRTPVKAIARELDADYLLTGSVQTIHSQNGGMSARVTLRLIRGPDQTYVWGELFMIPLEASELLRIQSEVAIQVARALNVGILEGERGVLESRPTTSMEAYEFFLRGREYLMGAAPEEDLRVAVQMYQRAVRLDPNFAAAHAALARAHLQLWWRSYDRSAARLASAKAALDRALELDSLLTEARIALGYYYFWGLLDFDRGLEVFDSARARQPRNADILYGIGSIHRRRGHMEEALENLLQAEEVDPRSALVARDIANTYSFLRDAAAAERYFHRAIELDPGWPTYVRDAMRVHLRLEGDLTDTKRVLAEARDLGFRHPLLTTLSTWVEISEGDFEEALNLLDPMRVDAVEANSFYIPRPQLYAEIHGLLGNDRLRRMYYDSSRAVAEARLGVTPDDPRVHSALGIAYAGLGRRADALREGERAIALRPVEEDAWHGVYRVESLAVIHTMLGDHDEAVALLEYLLSTPGTLTVPFLRIDYRFAALRDHPGFRALLARAD